MAADGRERWAIVPMTGHDGLVTDQRTRLEHDDVRALVDEVFEGELAEPPAGGDEGPDDPDDGDHGGGDGRPDRPEGDGQGRRRIDKTLLGASLVIAIGLSLVLRGLFVGVTADERAGLPDQIESVLPVPNAVQVLSQSSIFVDLESGYTGVLVIDGEEIETVGVDEVAGVQAEPGQQVDLPPATIYAPGNATLTFTPTEGAPVETLATGEHTAEVIYWRIEDGRLRARTFTWTFEVV